MKNKVLIMLPVFVTTILWFAAKLELSEEINFNTVLSFISQLSSLLGLTLLVVMYIFKSSKISKHAFALVLLHPLFIIFNLTNSFEFFLNSQWQAYAILGFYTLLVLVSVYRYLPQKANQFSYKYIGIIVILGGFHAFFSESITFNYFALKYWMLLVLAIGTIVYFNNVAKYLIPKRTLLLNLLLNRKN